MTDPRSEAKHSTIAGDLVAATMAGELDEVAGFLGELTAGDRAGPIRVLGALTRFCAAAVSRYFGPQREDIVFTAVLESAPAVPADIEVLAPGVRAALRAVLAELNGDQAGLEIQLDLATRGSQRDVAPVLAHCLMWAVELGCGEVPGFTVE